MDSGSQWRGDGGDRPRTPVEMKGDGEDLRRVHMTEDDGPRSVAPAARSRETSEDFAGRVARFLQELNTTHRELSRVITSGHLNETAFQPLQAAIQDVLNRAERILAPIESKWNEVNSILRRSPAEVEQAQSRVLHTFCRERGIELGEGKLTWGQIQQRYEASFRGVSEAERAFLETFQAQIHLGKADKNTQVDHEEYYRKIHQEKQETWISLREAMETYGETCKMLHGLEKQLNTIRDQLETQRPLMERNGQQQEHAMPLERLYRERAEALSSWEERVLRGLMAHTGQPVSAEQLEMSQSTLKMGVSRLRDILGLETKPEAFPCLLTIHGKGFAWIESLSQLKQLPGMMVGDHRVMRDLPIVILNGERAATLFSREERVLRGLMAHTSRPVSAEHLGMSQSTLKMGVSRLRDILSLRADLEAFPCLLNIHGKEYALVESLSQLKQLPGTTIGDYRVVRDLPIVVLNEERAITLPPREERVLRGLMAHTSQPVNAEQLRIEPGNLQRAVAELRALLGLGADPGTFPCLLNIRGKGYALIESRSELERLPGTTMER
jgi:DNA-binding response OmpR family regulator